ncbi:unnamed protein product [Closterium sp. Naga37s-1]|nr:unnamed protein product [Closterium sp. Naga37s-1]
MGGRVGSAPSLTKNASFSGAGAGRASEGEFGTVGGVLIENLVVDLKGVERLDPSWIVLPKSSSGAQSKGGQGEEWWVRERRGGWEWTDVYGRKRVRERKAAPSAASHWNTTGRQAGDAGVAGGVAGEGVEKEGEWKRGEGGGGGVAAPFLSSHLQLLQSLALRAAPRFPNPRAMPCLLLTDLAGERVILESQLTSLVTNVAIQPGTSKTYAIRAQLPPAQLPPPTAEQHCALGGEVGGGGAGKGEGNRGQGGSANTTPLKGRGGGDEGRGGAAAGGQGKGKGGKGGQGGATSVVEVRVPLRIWTLPNLSGLTVEELDSDDHYGVGAPWEVPVNASPPLSIAYLTLNPHSLTTSLPPSLASPFPPSLPPSFSLTFPRRHSAHGAGGGGHSVEGEEVPGGTHGRLGDTHVRLGGTEPPAAEEDEEDATTAAAAAESTGAVGGAAGRRTGSPVAATATVTEVGGGEVVSGAGSAGLGEAGTLAAGTSSDTAAAAAAAAAAAGGSDGLQSPHLTRLWSAPLPTEEGSATGGQQAGANEPIGRSKSMTAGKQFSENGGGGGSSESLSSSAADGRGGGGGGGGAGAAGGGAWARSSSLLDLEPDSPTLSELGGQAGGGLLFGAYGGAGNGYEGERGGDGGRGGALSLLNRPEEDEGPFIPRSPGESPLSNTSPQAFPDPSHPSHQLTRFHLQTHTPRFPSPPPHPHPSFPLSPSTPTPLVSPLPLHTHTPRFPSPPPHPHPSFPLSPSTPTPLVSPLPLHTHTPRFPSPPPHPHPSFPLSPSTPTPLVSPLPLHTHTPRFPSPPPHPHPSFPLSPPFHPWPGVRGRTYNIRIDDHVLVRFTPRNPQPVYYLGDVVSGTLSFPIEDGPRRCLEVSVLLEMHEVINPRALHTSRRVAAAASAAKTPLHLPVLQMEHHEVTVDLLHTHFIFTIPSDAAASFATPIISLQWILRFEFCASTRRPAPPSSTPGSAGKNRQQQQPQQQMHERPHALAMGAETERGEWSMPITVHPPLPKVTRESLSYPNPLPVIAAPAISNRDKAVMPPVLQQQSAMLNAAAAGRGMAGAPVPPSAPLPPAAVP